MAVAPRPCIATTGFFDGVHSGHREVIDTLVAEAGRRGCRSLVVTLWPHPRAVLQDDARFLRLLMSLDEKVRRLRELGVEQVEVLEFTREFSLMGAEAYLRDVLQGRFGAKAVLIGYDNRLGGDRLPPEDIARIAGGLGLEVIRSGRAASPQVAPVSSTMIRRTLSEGDIALANSLLGYRYGLRGVVVEGNRLGRTIGFPTANMQLYEPLKLIPGNGVYEVEVDTLGERFRGMCNIGIRPTLGSGNARTIETHIFAFDQDIYGLDIGIRFVRKIRDEVQFPSLEALRGQLCRDREAVAGTDEMREVVG